MSTEQSDKFLPGIGNYAKTIAEKIERRKVIEDVNDIYRQLQGSIWPMLELDIRFKGNDLDKDVLPYLSKYGFRQKNLVDALRSIFGAIRENENDVMDMIDKVYGTVVVKDAIDYRLVNVQYYIEGLQYVTDMARQLIQVYVAKELEKKTGRKLSVVDRESLEYISAPARLEAFARLVNILIQPVGKFMKTLDKLHGVLYDAASYDVTRQREVLDPAGFGFLPVALNPVHRIGLVWNTWQEARRQRLIDEVARFNMMVLMLREEHAAVSDKAQREKLEKQIAYYDNEINRKTAKIQRIEDV